MDKKEKIQMEYETWKKQNDRDLIYSKFLGWFSILMVIVIIFTIVIFGVVIPLVRIK